MAISDLTYLSETVFAVIPTRPEYDIISGQGAETTTTTINKFIHIDLCLGSSLLYSGLTRENVTALLRIPSPCFFAKYGS
jgi:hypothetical protein